MFVAHASRTMANAKPKFREAENETIGMEVLREIRRKRRFEEERRRWREDQERIRILRETAVQEAKARAETMRELAGVTRYRPSAATIVRRISRATGISADLIRSDRRNREIVLAKQAVAYWTVRLTMLSYPQIGRLMGGKDHTTVLHSRKAYPEKRARMGRYLRPVR